MTLKNHLATPSKEINTVFFLLLIVMLLIGYTAVAQTTTFDTANEWVFQIDDQGNVGIGQAPKQKLEVRGSVGIGYRWNNGNQPEGIKAIIGKPDVNGMWGAGSAFLEFPDQKRVPNNMAGVIP